MMLDALVQGMRDAGAEVETIHLREKKVKNCIGCFTCWTKTPGVCVHKDDMTNELFPKWLEADIAVYATPLYHYTVNATMKAFIERTLPMVEPFLDRLGDSTSHPLRQKPPKAVVLSVAGFPEASVFAQLSSYVNFLFGKGLVAEIYRPAAEGMSCPNCLIKRRTFLKPQRKAVGNWFSPRRSPKRRWNESPSQSWMTLTSWPRWQMPFGRLAFGKGLTPREFQRKEHDATSRFHRYLHDDHADGLQPRGRG